MRRLIALTAALGCTTVLAACGREADSSSTASPDSATITVAATTRQVADFARQVGGDRVRVATIIPANADPHDFEPRPSDARLVATSDVVLQSGGDIDGWLDDLVENAGGDAERVDLIDAVKTREGGHHHAEDEHAGEGDEHAGEAEEHAGEADEHADDEVDPHWWQNPQNVVLAAARIEQALAQADPDGADTYAANRRAYTTDLEALDAEIETCLDSVPESNRKLVTNHDAFGYFADRYHVEVLGSIIPALSTSAQASAGDVRRLVASIKREGVTTIFPESALRRRLEQAVARDAGVEVGEPLFADTLGPQADATYTEVLAHDASLMAASFGARCRVEG